MTEKEPIEHDDVISSLLDLQRRLRDGDGGGAEDPAGETSSVGAAPTVVEAPHVDPPRADPVEVTDRDLSVLMTPGREPQGADHGSDPPPRDRFAPVTQLPTTSAGEDRVAALTERLSRVEDELSGVLGSLDSVRGTVAAEVAADVAERMIAIQQATDERTVRLVTHRMDAVSNRVTNELEEQRRDLAGLLDRRMVDMEASLRDAIRDVADDPEDGAQPPSAAP